MTFKITVDSSAVEKRLDRMTETLKELGTKGIGDELFNWEAEDLHRKKPWAQLYKRGRRASTTIRPHSLAEMKRSRQTMMRARRRRSHRGLRQHWSTRPILRAELYTKLVERMHALLATVKW
jgi:hypothetical protein